MKIKEKTDVTQNGRQKTNRVEAEAFFLRDMVKSDIPEILALQEQILREGDFDHQWFYPFSEEELKELVDEKNGIFIGAFAGDRLVAFRAGCFSGEEYDEITGALGSPYTETACFLMNGVFVHKDYRGHHLQQTLTEECMKRCEEIGINTFLSVTHPENRASMTSLKNVGFVERSRQMLFHGKYDRVILVKEEIR
jgi:GNAT superfamily N-acetyltransferase